MLQLRLRCAAIFLSPGPKHDSTSTFWANGLKRHGSVPSAGWPLPSSKTLDTNIISSGLAACPRSCVVLCCCRCHSVSNIHGHCCPRAANPPITILLYTPCQLDSANIHNATVSLSTVHAPTSNSHHTAPKLPLLASCSYKLSATSSARPPYTLLSSTHLTPDCYATQWAFAPI